MKENLSTHQCTYPIHNSNNISTYHIDLQASVDSMIAVDISLHWYLPNGSPLTMLNNTIHVRMNLFHLGELPPVWLQFDAFQCGHGRSLDRKSTRLNSSHVRISYA